MEEDGKATGRQRQAKIIGKGVRKQKEKERQ